MDYERYEFQQPTWGGVNVLRIGDTLVDTGHVAAICRDEVAAALEAELAGLERVLITHPHIDHVGGSQTIDALAELPHIVPDGVPAILRDYTGYLQRARQDMTRLLAGFGVDEDSWDHYFPLGAYSEARIPIHRVLADGDHVTIGGYELEAVYTPGHSAQHLAFWHPPSGTCFSADLVSQNGHFMYGPLYADVGAYKESLQRVRALEPDVLVPMHGEPMHEPRERLDDALAKAATTEEKLLDWHDDQGPFYAREFAAEVLGATATTAPFLTLVVYEYLKHLADRVELDVAVTDEGIQARPA